MLGRFPGQRRQAQPRVLSQNLARHHSGRILLAQSQCQGQPWFEVWEERPFWTGALPGGSVKGMGPTGVETTRVTISRSRTFPFALVSPPSGKRLPSSPDTPVQVHEGTHETLQGLIVCDSKARETASEGVAGRSAHSHRRRHVFLDEGARRSTAASPGNGAGGGVRVCPGFGGGAGGGTILLFSLYPSLPQTYFCYTPV